MELEYLPEHLIILGSGYIGLEFAQMFRRFGCRVTVIGQSEQILSQQDPDMAIAVQRLLERDGIEFLLKTNIPGIWVLGDINSGPEYTHVSLDDYRIVKANLIDEGNRSTRVDAERLVVKHRLVPSCLFWDYLLKNCYQWMF